MPWLEPVTLRGAHARLEASFARPCPCQRRQIRPDACRKTCVKRDAHGGGLELHWAFHRRLQHVGKELAEPVVGRHLRRDPERDR